MDLFSFAPFFPYKILESILSAIFFQYFCEFIFAHFGELPASSEKDTKDRTSNIGNDLKTLQNDVVDKQDENATDDDLSNKVIRTLDSVLGVYGFLLQTLINLVLVSAGLFDNPFHYTIFRMLHMLLSG